MPQPTFYKLAQNINWRGVVALAGAAAGAELLAQAVQGLTGIIMKKKYFHDMLEENPHLADIDPKVLAKYWASLYHFAPHVAADPLAAGAYLTQVISKVEGTSLAGPPIDTYLTLSNINKVFETPNNKRYIIPSVSQALTTGLLTHGLRSAIDN